MNCLNISVLKYLIRRKLNITNPLLRSRGLRNIQSLIGEIFENVICKVDVHDLPNFCSLFFKICYITECQEHEVKHLQKLRKTYEKTEILTIEKVKIIKMSPSTCYQDILSEDITALRKVVGEYNFSERNVESFFIYKNNLKVQAEIEMLILSILSSLEYSILYLITNQQSNEDGNPFLVGRYLRKYLAHGNPLVDILTDSTQSIYLYALKIIKHDIYQEENFTIKRIKDRSNARYTVENQEKLFRALSSNSLDEVIHRIKDGADIYGRDNNLRTALHFASKASNIENIKHLINLGLNPKAKDFYNRNLLHVAAASGCKDTVDYIIEQLEISVDEKCERDKTALHIAAESSCVDVVKSLLHHNAKIDVIDISLETPIHKAVINNRIDIVKLFIENIEDINSIRNEGGFTLLHIAAEMGFSDMVVFLLDNGADVNASTDDFVTPLHVSSSAGHLEIVKTLISRGANVNVKCEGNVTPLHSAVEFGHLSIVEYLIEHGANINALNNEKRLPLHYAIREKHMNIFKTLINKGASLEDIAICGDSVYKYAIINGNLDVINFLIENKVPINLRDPDDCTPLHISIFTYANDISKLLIERGADINAVDKIGFTPLRHSILNGNFEIASMLLLRKEAFSLSAVNGFTLLHCCAYTTKYSAMCLREYAMIDKENYDEIASNSSMFSIFKTLVEMAAEVMGDRVMEWVQEKNENGLSALHLACISGNTDIVKYLIKKLSLLNIPDNRGYTPLHCAVEFNNLEVVKLLLSSPKCSLNSTTLEGDTALCLASQNNNKEIAQALIKNKADVNAGNPIFTAASMGYQDMCLMLLNKKKRLEKHIEDEDAWLLSTASFRGLKEVVSYILHNMSLSEEFSLEKALFYAIDCGYDEIVTLILDHGADVNFFFEEYNASPLHIAARRGHSKIIRALLDKGADLNKLDSKHRRPIELAVWHGDLDSVKIFFQNKTADVNEKVNGDFTLLQIAVESGHLDMVKLLISEKPSLNVANSFGSKPIHIAAREGQLHILDYFIQYDEKLLRERGCANMSLLHYAAQEGRTDIAKYLIQKGLDVNEPGDNGVRPIHLASMFGFEEVLKVLLNNGAIYDCIHDIFQGTPLLLSDKENVKEMLLMIEELFHSVKVNNISNVKSLIEKGACINSADSGNATLLHYAAWKGYTEIIQILMKNNANPNVFGRKNTTPLHYASKYGKFEAAKHLLENGAIYNAMSTDRKTPLDLASSKNMIDLLKLIDSAFENVQNYNIQILTSLKKVENSDLLKSIAFAKNEEGKTVINCAVLSNFPKLKDLKIIIAKNFEIFSHEIIRLFNSQQHPVALQNENNTDISRKRYEQIINYFKESFQNWEEAISLSKAKSLKVRSFIARAMHKLGRNIEAIQLFEVVFPQQNEMFGLNNLDTLRTLYDMALVLNGLGRHEEAMKANNTVYEKYLEMYGTDDPLTLAAQSNIGITFTKLCKYDEALSIYKCIYEKERKALGPLHLHTKLHTKFTYKTTLSTLNNIIYILFSQNKLYEAVAGLREMLYIQENSLGPEHMDTLRTENKLGLLLFQMNNFLQANKILKENVRKLKPVLGDKDSTVLETEQLIEIMKYPLDYLNLWRSKDSHTTNQEHHPVEEIHFEGRSELLHIAVNEGHTSLVNYLLQEKCDVMHANNKGYTALHIASSKGHANIAESLLIYAKENNFQQLSTFINAKTKDIGNSALHVAANVETAITLLQHSAVYNTQNKEGKTPKDCTTVKEIFDFLQLIDELFMGASIGDSKIVPKLEILGSEEILGVSNARNEMNFTLLQVCLTNGHKELLKQLT